MSESAGNTKITEKIIEARIVELEKKLYGLEGKPKGDCSVSETNVIESLEHANTLISSALSGREKLNTLIERLPELEEYEKSDYEPVDLNLDMKLEYILAMEPEIRKNANQWKRLNDLLPVLDSDRFNNLPEMTERLNNISLQYLDLGEQTDRLDLATREMVARYNTIITNISKTLIALDAEVTELEDKAKPKKVED